MKRMLIIGNEFDGIKSVPFDEVKSVNITDYQIVLIDLTNYQDIDTNLCGYIRTSLHSLYDNNYPIVFILPRTTFSDAEAPMRLCSAATIAIRSKSGDTVTFQNDGLMDIYRDFITKHEVVFTAKLLQDLGADYEPLMWDNIKDCCSALKKCLYLLHPPDKHLHEKAIASLVEYFSPDMEEEKEDKPDWVEPYELNNLGLRKIENKINEVEEHIVKLSDEKNRFIVEKEKIAKWADLITKKGKALEMRLMEAFELLGVEKIEHEPNGNHGPDLVIQHNKKCLTVEIEGSKGPIKIIKARQLLHWMADAPPDHKGVLIGNPFRELTPDERPTNNRLFVKEAVDLAQNRDFVLITSHNLFDLVCKKLKGEKVNIDDIITKLCNGKGEINLAL